MTEIEAAPRTPTTLGSFGRTTGRGGVVVRQPYGTARPDFEGVVLILSETSFSHWGQGTIHFEPFSATGRWMQCLFPSWRTEERWRDAVFEFKPLTAWANISRSDDLLTFAALGDDLNEVGYAAMEATIVSPTRADPSQALLAHLEQARTVADVDEEETDAAERALGDARAFAQQSLSGRLPRVHISDDGVVTFHWRGKSSGVLLVFVGDGKVTCSMKSQGGLYAVGSTSFGIGDALPEDLEAAIKAVEYGID